MHHAFLNKIKPTTKEKKDEEEVKTETMKLGLK